MPCVFSMFNFNPVVSENLSVISKSEGLPTSVRVKSLCGVERQHKGLFHNGIYRRKN